tara:strand:+ start:129 stop:698 length:570 start_codon:yes stop_codon:yes gene_type:complete
MEAIKKPDVATNEASGLPNNTSNHYIKLLTKRETVREPASKIAHNTSIEVVGDKQPLVERSVYEFSYHSTWSGHLYGGAPKLMIVFRIVTLCSDLDKKLCRCYNLKTLNKKRGDFAVGRRSDFYYEYVKLFGVEPKNTHRISMTPFKNVIIKASVRTVDTDYKQRPLPEPMRYSIIRELLSVEAGGINL